MANEELRDQIVKDLKSTTISYPEYQKRVAAGTYNGRESTSTGWGRALVGLAKISDTPKPTQIEQYIPVIVGSAGYASTSRPSFTMKSYLPTPNFHFFIDGLPAGVGTPGDNSTVQFTSEIDVSDGLHVITGKDSVSGSVVTPVTFGIVTDVPAAPTSLALASWSLTQDGKGITVVGDATPNVTVRLIDSASQLGGTVADATGKYLIGTTPLRAGTYSLVAKAYSKSGLPSAASATLIVTIT